MTMANAQGPRIALIGGGIIGLSLAWRLAQGGAAVTLFDRSVPGRAASWAAAGMLAAGAEAGGAPDLSRAGQRALALWPRFAAELEAGTGQSVGYRTMGLLHVGFAAQREALLHAFAQRQAAGEEVAWLERDALCARAPALDTELDCGVLGLSDSHVSNRLVAEALVAMAEAAGVTIRPKTPVNAVHIRGNGRVALKLADEVFEADKAVLTAGAWTREITGIPEALTQIELIRGQAYALGFATADLARLLPHIVWGPDVYLVPRPDGTILVGASVEPGRTDPVLDPEVEYRLHQAACAVVPSLENLQVTERWVGFRPGTPDGLPVVGPTEAENLWIAGGHFRNGILLAPLTAELMAQALLSGASDADLESWSPARLQRISKRARL